MCMFGRKRGDRKAYVPDFAECLCMLCMATSCLLLFHSLHFHGLFLSSPGLLLLSVAVPLSQVAPLDACGEVGLGKEQLVQPLGPLYDQQWHLMPFS